MADSTHILKLKATLDTSEVKSKLDQLRQAQQQALGNNQKSGNTPSQSVGGNLTQLTSTLNRLNTTMMQMQRTLSQLAVGNKIHQQSSSVSLLPPMSLTSQTQNKAANIIDRFINKKSAKLILDYAREGRLDGLENMYKSTSTDWATRYFQTKLTPASTGMSFETWKNWMSKKEIQKEFELQFVNPELNDKINDKRNRAINNLQMLKPIAGLAIHQGASMIGDFARQNGDNTTAFYAQSVGKIGGYAMIGSVAGPWGVAVGGALGAIDSLFDKFTEKAKEAQKQLEDWNKNIERSQTFKKTYDEVKETRSLNSQISKAVKNDDIARLNFIADQIQKKIDLNSKFLEGQRSSSEYGDTAENIMEIFNQQEKSISQLEHIKSLIDQINEKKQKEAEIDKKNLDNYRKQADILKQSFAWSEEENQNNTEINLRKSDYDTFGDNYRNQVDILKQSYKWNEEDRQNNAEITLGTYDYDTFGDKYSEYRTKYLDFKLQYKTNLDKAQNATTSESAKQFLDIASRMKSAMDFNKSQMDLFGGSQLEMLNNYRKEADILKQSFAWSEEDRQNNAKILLGDSYSDTIGPYDDYNTLGANYSTYRAKYRYFKFQYKTNLDKVENATTSESAKQFLDIASKMKDAMNFNKSQMDLFGGSQLEMLNNLLSKIKAPDMTNVTSLASQGLMTYGKDEQLVDLQVDYMKQQLDVQKQIKDKMREHVEFE